MSECDAGASEGARPGRGGKWSTAPLNADQQRLAERWIGAAHGAVRRWSRRRPDLREEFRSAALYAVCLAAKNFDGTRGYKFFTYLRHHLRHARKEVIRLSVPKGYRITGSLRTPAARAARANRPGISEVRETDLVERDRDRLEEAENIAAVPDRVQAVLSRLSPIRRALVERTVLGGEPIDRVAAELGYGAKAAREIRRLALRQLGAAWAPGGVLRPLED